MDRLTRIKKDKAVEGNYKGVEGNENVSFSK